MAAGVVNYPLVAGLLAFAVAQSAKFFTTWYKEKRWDARQFIASGGMPSSHSATVTALAVSVGIQEGFRSATFATSMILACVDRTDPVHRSSHTRWGLGRNYRNLVLPLLQCNAERLVRTQDLLAQVGRTSPLRQVMHDAFGVRLHAGKQAEVLNQIVYELPIEHPLAETKPLREILGHTVPQVVAGCILGILTAVIMLLALGSYT